jgi:hypothetical protein
VLVDGDATHTHTHKFPYRSAFIKYEFLLTGIFPSSQSEMIAINYFFVKNEMRENKS